jgi:hypothetical protein
MGTEELYTNGFDATLVNWAETGNSPYLQDTDTDYISTASNTDEGYWTFPNSAGSDTINSVKIRVEYKMGVSGAGVCTVYVFDGSSWHDVGTITAQATNYTWKEFDVSAILDTWAKINGAKVYVSYERLKAGTFYARRLTRKVDYTPAAGGLSVPVAMHHYQMLMNGGQG